MRSFDLRLGAIAHFHRRLITEISNDSTTTRTGASGLRALPGSSESHADGSNSLCGTPTLGRRRRKDRRCCPTNAAAR